MQERARRLRIGKIENGIPKSALMMIIDVDESKNRNPAEIIVSKKRSRIKRVLILIFWVKAGVKNFVRIVMRPIPAVQYPMTSRPKPLSFINRGIATVRMWLLAKKQIVPINMKQNARLLFFFISSS